MYALSVTSQRPVHLSHVFLNTSCAGCEISHAIVTASKVCIQLTGYIQACVLRSSVSSVVREYSLPHEKTCRACRGRGSGNGKKNTHNSANQSNEGRRNCPARAVRTLERRRRNAEEQVRHKNEPKDPNITWLPAEDEDGNVEYKLRLKDPGAGRLEQLVRHPPTPKLLVRNTEQTQHEAKTYLPYLMTQISCA